VAACRRQGDRNQIRIDDTKDEDLLGPGSQAHVTATRAERAFLAALDGGGQVPIGALVSDIGGAPTLYGMLADLSGRHIVRGSRALDLGSPESTGEALAAEIRSRGGTSLLVELRQLRSFPPRNQSKRQLSTVPPAALRRAAALRNLVRGDISPLSLSCPCSSAMGKRSGAR
jgi:hypothetical protein